MCSISKSVAVQFVANCRSNNFQTVTSNFDVQLQIPCTVAIGKPERQVRKASHCGSKQQQRSHAMITLLLLVRATYVYMGVILCAHPVRGELHIQRYANREVATALPSLVLLQHHLP